MENYFKEQAKQAQADIEKINKDSEFIRKQREEINKLFDNLEV